MPRLYRTYLLLGLLTFTLASCGDANDPISEDAPSDDALNEEGESDGEAPATAEPDDRASTGSVRDAGKAASELDAGAAPARDAGVDGEGAVDAGAPREDAGATSVCPQTDGWDPQAAAFEEEVLVLTNQARAAGHDCNSRGKFGPAPALTTQNQLRCAARLHSQYMATSGVFSHTQASGKDPGARIREAGYVARTWGENIAWGQRSPREVVSGWLESDGHCANLMSPAFKQLGVGFAQGSRSGRQAPYWTQVFGTSR